MTDDGAWFGQRRGGSRNLPISWQGWLATILYGIGAFLAFFLPAVWGLAHGGLVSFTAFALLTIVFGFICVRKSR
jgi:uncharacterized membrane protein YeaQ/YmgE (transglycosylase-associated protein family)